MRALTVAFLVLLVVCSCSLEPSKMSATITLEAPEGEYLTVSQERDAKELIGALNDKLEGRYWLWMDYTKDNEAVTEVNNTLYEDGIIGVYIDVCKDGTLYVDSLDADIVALVDDINALNSNSFSRVMFFIDKVAVYTTGDIITVYNPDKDIFGA